MAHPVDAMLQRRDATLSKSRASDITDRHREDASSNATEDASRPEGSAREVPAGGVAGAAVDGSGAEDALLSSSRGCCASARRVIRLLNTSFFCYTIGLACAYGAVSTAALWARAPAVQPDSPSAPYRLTPPSLAPPAFPPLAKIAPPSLSSPGPALA
jgi:hypothetical protein